MIWPFKKRGLGVPAPARFPPSREAALTWMRLKVLYYKEKHPKTAWRLFSPYGADYLPIALATTFAWDDEMRGYYSQIKDENPSLVGQATFNRPKDGAVVISKVGEYSDFDPNIRLL